MTPEQAKTEALNISGVTNMQQGVEAMRRGDYLAGAGQAATGVGEAATLLPLPLGAMARGVRAAAPTLERVLRDTSGALKVPKKPPPQTVFPEYAEQYPPIAPPVVKTGKTEAGEAKDYEGVVRPDEIKPFIKARDRVKAAMKREGYEPYFDVEKRFNVDPKNYPPRSVDTLQNWPTKPEALQKYVTNVIGDLENIGASQTAKNLRDAYQRGLKLGDTKDWYAMGQLEAEYIDELGAEAGRAAFLDNWVMPMAATTTGQQPGPNLMTAHLLEFMRKAKGDPANPRDVSWMPTKHELPFPVGGRRAEANLTSYKKMREAGGYPYLTKQQPKMGDYAWAFLGDLSHAPIDEQMAGGMLKGVPVDPEAARKTGYGPLQKVLHTVAEEEGLLPGNLQDVAWFGFKNTKGQSMISVLNDAIERTRRLTGLDARTIVRRGVIRKELPLYGWLAAFTAGGGAGLGAQEQ